MSAWRGEAPARRALRLAGDGSAALVALWAAFAVRINLPLPFTRELLPGDRLRFLSREWLVVVLLQFATLYFFGFYDAPRPRSRTEIARHLVGAAAFQAMGLIAWWFLANREFPRSVLLLFVVFNFTLLLGWRIVLDRTERRRERRVAIVGGGAAARELARTLQREPWHGLRVAGWVTTRGEPEEESELGPCLGTPENLAALLAAGEIEDILLVGSGDTWQTRLIDSLAGTRPDHTNVLLLPDPFESLIGRMRYRWVHDLPLIEVVRETEWRINWPLKRLLDLSMGSLLLLAASPVMAICSLAVRLTSPGDVLYRQTRVGRGQKPFTLYKFRTMRQNAESESGEVLAQPGDPRLTPIGAFLRRYRLDEFPQLFNVLRGTMSLVGPRPERPGFVQRYLEEVPGYAERFSLAPGLTGLAQVNGDYYSSPQNKLRYDLAYMANWTVWLDLSILLRTVKIVLTSGGV
ncbi:MAG TPA: sugar transferase [Thermoanaerobaculia bacterium]|jgi:exopolysaccharide biosynthesis polyprenyl glycosylphosphotransferase|nr:sugar transferase [Thermoanaerobaculia bacterium]